MEYVRNLQVLVLNLGVKVLIGFTVVFKSFGGPLILKLTPKIPSPTSLGITMLPITAIFEINLFKFKSYYLSI